MSKHIVNKTVFYGKDDMTKPFSNNPGSVAANKHHTESHLRKPEHTLEPDDIDQFGKRYAHYDEYMKATGTISEPNSTK